MRSAGRASLTALQLLALNIILASIFLVLRLGKLGRLLVIETRAHSSEYKSTS